MEEKLSSFYTEVYSERKKSVDPTWPRGSHVGGASSDVVSTVPEFNLDCSSQESLYKVSGIP